MKKEWWAFIPGHEEYMASTLGRIISFNYQNTGKIGFLRGCNNRNGYNMIGLDGVYKGRHIWIALTFIPNPKKLPEVNHIDEDKMNCCVDNLEWTDRKGNCNHGTRNKRIGDANRNGKLSIPVVQIKPNGERIEYPSIQEAHRQTGILAQNIEKVLKGKRHTAGRCRWERKNKEPNSGSNCL